MVLGEVGRCWNMMGVGKALGELGKVFGEVGKVFVEITKCWES